MPPQINACEQSNPDLPGVPQAIIPFLLNLLALLGASRTSIPDIEIRKAIYVYALP